MARRRRTGAAEDIIDLAALLPWWIGVAYSFVVMSGRFTQEAKDFATGRNIRLVDGEALFALIQSTRKTGAGPAADTPACPLCGGGMVKRTAKRGSNAGQVLLGGLRGAKGLGRWRYR